MKCQPCQLIISNYLSFRSLCHTHTLSLSLVLCLLTISLSVWLRHTPFDSRQCAQMGSWRQTAPSPSYLEGDPLEPHLILNITRHSLVDGVQLHLHSPTADSSESKLSQQCLLI
eukprot:sb/3476909/